MVNVSEGRDPEVVGALAAAAGRPLLDVHTDGDHHRSVLTLAGTLSEVESSTRRVVEAAVERIDLRRHEGVHPRLGAADVVPVVPLETTEVAWKAAVEARERIARWIGDELGVPCFLYGPERSLPDVRRSAFRTLEPDTGPRRPHPSAGATAVGVRRPLIAYNVWLEAAAPRATGAGSRGVLAVARDLAGGLRSPTVRALGLAVGGGAQVSCNLLDGSGRALERVFDEVSAGAEERGCRVVRAELVGLLPRAALAEIPRSRWRELGVGEEATIEARVEELAGSADRGPSRDSGSGPRAGPADADPAP